MALHQTPLFPLGQVLFPNMVLSLHVFEPRYRAMVNRCIEQDIPFGVVLIHEGREAGGSVVPFEVGTMARITEVERLPDGRLNILTVGVNRFRLRGVVHDRPYPTGEIEFLEEPAGDAAQEKRLARQVTALFSRYLELFADLVAASESLGDTEEDGGEPEEEQSALSGGPADREMNLLTDRPELPRHPGALAYAVAAAAGWRQHEKQTLLELPSAADRLSAEARYLRRDIASMVGLRRRRSEGGRPPFIGPCSAN